MRLFLYLCASVAITTGICGLIYILAPNFQYDTITSNTIFILAIILVITFTDGEFSKSSHGLVLAPIMFLILLIVLAIGGVILFESLPALVIMLSLPMGVVGYYPSGPDAWLPYGIIIWVISTLIAIAIGVRLGSLLRTYRPVRLGARDRDP